MRISRLVDGLARTSRLASGHCMRSPTPPCRARFLPSHSLGLNEVCDYGTRALAEALMANVTLTTLMYVSGCGVAVVKKQM